MKINEPSRMGGVNPYHKSTAAPVNQTAAKKAIKDEVQISEEAKLLLNTVRNPEKLEQLKQSVSTGTYHVDAGKIAEKLLPYLE